MTLNKEGIERMFGIKFNEIKQKNALVRIACFTLLLAIVLILTLIKNITVTISFLSNGYVIPIILLIVTILLYLLVIKYLFNVYKTVSSNNEKMPFKRSIKYLIYALVAMIIFHVIVAITIHSTGFNKFDNSLGVLTIIILGIFYILLSPLIEELIIRGIFFNLFFQKPMKGLKNVIGTTNKANIFNLFLCILVSSFIFTILHNATGILPMLNYMFNGIIMGILYVKTKNIHICISYHMINNIIAYIPIMAYIF